jgi:hypothetical protein
LYSGRGEKELTQLTAIWYLNNNEIGKPENPNLLYPIDRVHYDGEEKTFKLLGVLFDEYLSFDDHISNLCGKISKSLYCMNRVKKF